MPTFRVIQKPDLKPSDFNDLPFWLDIDNQSFWISMQHTVVDGQLVDTLAIQRVVDNVAGPVWQHYPMDGCRDLFRDLENIAMGYVPVIYNSPAYIHKQVKHSNSGYRLTKASPCGCETHLGEPCYCKL